MTNNSQQRVVRKQLGVEEDLLYGEGEATQIRNGVEHTVNRVRSIRPVFSIAERDNLDTAKFRRCALFDAVTARVTFYSFNQGAWVEASIPSTAAATTFDNENTVLTSDDVQAALVEILSRITQFSVSQTGEEGAAELPVGTTAQRPATPSNGYIRFNTTLGQFEGFIGNAWGQIGGAGATGGGDDEIFVQNGKNVTTSYTIPGTVNASTVGPVTINAGASVTVEPDARWVIL